MPKKIYSDFSGGIADSDKNAKSNQFYAGAGVDIHREWGYIMPGFLKSNIAINNLNSDIVDIVHDTINSRAYAITNGARAVFEIYTDVDLDSESNTSFGSGAVNYVTIAGNTEAKGIIYAIRDTSSSDTTVRYAFIAYNGTAKNIGKGSTATNVWTSAALWDEDWLSTIPTGGATLNAGRRDIITWETYMWYTNGQYVGRINGNVYPNVATPTFFDLGKSWVADRLFPLGNYLAIVSSYGQSVYNPAVSRNANECRVTLIDGSSNTRAVKIIPLEGITQVHAIKNKNGTIFVWADDAGLGHIVGILTDDGLEEVKKVQHDVSGSRVEFLSPISNGAVAIYKGKTLFGTYGGKVAATQVNSMGGLIFQYGRKNINSETALSVPFLISNTASSRVTSVKPISADKIYAGYFDGTNYKLDKLSSGNSTPTIKWGYEDFGQKVRINYIKAYFKPLVSGDSITLGLDVDYGTSVPLGIGSGNIKNSLDGVATQKRFDIKKICHSFRPTVTWVSGGTAISKIVVDYDFVDDL